MASSVLRQLSLFYISEMYGEASHVFVDGSVTASSSAAAVVMPGKDLTQRFKIAYRTSSTAAELVGLREALRIISCERPQQ